MLGDGRTNVLFVGRLAPNKRHEDLIRLAAYWKRFISPDLRLLLVGKLPRTPPATSTRCRPSPTSWASPPGRCVFTGHVDHDELLACYAAAHVFVSMSEHEGFGVPLVEAMLMRVPVLAYAARRGARTRWAAPGVQFDGRSACTRWRRWRTAWPRTRPLREAVLAGQDRRLAAFAPEAVEAAAARAT